jgi:hypothetical protein
MEKGRAGRTMDLSTVLSQIMTDLSGIRRLGSEKNAGGDCFSDLLQSLG